MSTFSSRKANRKRKAGAAGVFLREQNLRKCRGIFICYFASGQCCRFPLPPQHWLHCLHGKVWVVCFFPIPKRSMYKIYLSICLILLWCLHISHRDHGGLRRPLRLMLWHRPGRSDGSEVRQLLPRRRVFNEGRINS